MNTINFNRNIYGNGLTIDSVLVSQIDRAHPSLYELHTTTFYEVFFFKQVEGNLIIDGKRLPLSGPMVVLFPPLTERTWEMAYGPESTDVFFESEFVESFLKDPAFLFRLHFYSCNFRVPVLPLNEEQVLQIEPLVQAIRTELKSQNPDRVYLLRSYLYQLLLLINRIYNAYHQLDSNLFNNSEIIQFKTLLKQHIHNMQTVQAYAEMMNMPRNRMNELCVKVFGKQAHLLIRDELLQACKTDLLNTSLSIAEISYKYNFSAPSNFTRFFRSYEGMSPASYREQFAE